jgi:hypothetical protein
MKKLFGLIVITALVFFLYNNNAVNHLFNKNSINPVISTNKSTEIKTSSTKNKVLKTVVRYITGFIDETPNKEELSNTKNNTIEKSKQNEPIAIVMDDSEYPPAPIEVQEQIDNEIKQKKEDYKNVQIDSTAVVLCKAKNPTNCINKVTDSAVCATQRQNCSDLYKYESLDTQSLNKVVGVTNTEKIKINEETLKTIGSSQGNIQFNK